MPAENHLYEEPVANLSHDPGIKFSRKKRPLLLGLITFILLAALIGTLTYQRYLINKDRVEKETYDFVAASKEKLQEVLMQGATATRILSFFIQKDGTVKDFDSSASQILAANKSIDVLQLVPDGVIRYVYPLKGNEKVIGYDILNDAGRNKEALKAIQKKELFYAGPFELKQGGIAIVGRLPVFRENKFWGFSAVVINLPTLLKSAGIDSLEKSGYYFQLSKLNPDNNKEEFFIHQPQNSDHDNSISVKMYNGEWKLSAIPVNPNKGYEDILWLSLLGFLVSVMGGFFVFTVVRKPEKLDHLVKVRTAALQESEERYRSLIEQAPDGVIVYSFDGTIHQFNKAAYMESGYTQKEFAQLNLNDLLVEKKERIGQSVMDDMKSGKKTKFQRKFNNKDGSIIDIEVNAKMLPDDRLLAFIRNITDRQNTERALKESEEKFSKAFQSNLLAFAIYDEYETVVDANERYAAILETTVNNIVGKKTEETKLVNKVYYQNRDRVRKTIKNTMAERRA